jgi:hypothetical protein
MRNASRLYKGTVIPSAKVGTHSVSSHGSGSKLLDPFSGELRQHADLMPGYC